ncbi:hypothetical protein [Endozoicomonas sp. YOMI1]|uniref:hypothetical protein n=1 Tax=Endozoicomonas sp. YOMI1 TaxID=2828739 RepID=UPI002147D43A|nr:hypothetical protein [Endozoicomonas sp. YOMI1]
MEDRIEKKVSQLMTLYKQIYLMIEQDVNQGARHPNELKELETRTGSWVTELNMAILRHISPAKYPSGTEMTTCPFISSTNNSIQGSRKTAQLGG